MSIEIEAWKIEAWKEKIVGAIEDPDNEFPGRAGETPLSNMMDRLQSLESTASKTAALYAIISLVKERLMPNNTEPWQRYWKGLVHLSCCLPNRNSVELRGAFYARLFGMFGINAVEDYLKFYVLEGFIASGGKLSMAELKKLGYLKQQSPLHWISAAIASSYFETAEREILEFAKNNETEASSILLRFASWGKQWESKESFASFAERLRNVLKKEEDTLVLDKWLEFLNSR